MTNSNDLNFLQLEEIAQQLRAKLGIEEQGFIDITDLAEEMGYQVYEAALEDSDMIATYRKEDGEISIYVQEDLPEAEKRYAIALQVAHAILNHHADLADDEYLVDYRQPYKGCKTSSEFGKKTQTILLASAILMPRSTVQQAWEKSPSVSTMVQLFHLPQRIIEMRLDNLGLNA